MDKYRLNMPIMGSALRRKPTMRTLARDGGFRLRSRKMRRSIAFFVLLGVMLVALPYRAPAPLVYRAGEGWVYEWPGAKGDWHRTRAKEQLAVAQQAFDQKKFKLALRAAKRVITIWPLSDYAPRAQYLMGRCYEQRRMDQKAFDAYQICIEKYPKMVDTTELQQRQYTIAVRFLNGEWTKLWGYVPFFPSMDKAADMFEKIVRFGPYGPLGAPSQMDIGRAREKQKDYPLAVEAYERASDRYNDQPTVAADALFKEGVAYEKQAKKADYDQSVAGQAMSTFSDFMSLYPDDTRVTNAQTIIGALKSEEARGNFNIAKYYEKNKKWEGALIYYNEVMLKDPSSPLAAQARARIEVLKKRTTAVPPAPATPKALPAQ